MKTSTVSAVTLCGVAAVVMALFCVAAVEAKTLPNKLMPGAKPFVTFAGIGRYSIHLEATNWTEAHRTCLLENGHLAMIKSEEEVAIIFDMMETNSMADIHIGLHDSFSEGKFVSIRGPALKTLGYQAWESGQPAGGITESFCGLKNGGIGSISTGFYDISSTAQFPFICELPMWDGYDLITGHGYYKLHNEPSTWKDSVKTCRSEGAYLLVLTSTLERDAVLDMYMDSLSSQAIWYGAHQMFADQLFITIFDELLDKSGFNSWVYDDPPTDFPNIEYPYLALYTLSVSNNHNLLFVNPTDQLPFICKHDLHNRA